MHTVRVAIRVRFRHRSRSAPQGAEFFLPGKRRGTGRELRAFAERRLRPAAVPIGTANSSFKIQYSKLSTLVQRLQRQIHPRRARSRADGPATWRSSPPPGGGCWLPVTARPNLRAVISTTTSGCGLPIASQSSSSQNTSAIIGGCELPTSPTSNPAANGPNTIATSGRSLRRPARCGPAGRELRAFAAGGCGPPMPNGIDPAGGEPAAERTGLRRGGAALRQGAAAGCRSLRDRICKQTFSPQQTAAARRPLRARSTTCAHARPHSRYRIIRCNLLAIVTLIALRCVSCRMIAASSSSESSSFRSLACSSRINRSITFDL